MPGEADGEDAAVALEGGNADGDLGFDGVGLGVDDGDGIVVGIRDEDFVGRDENAGGTAAAVDGGAEGESGADEALDLGGGGRGDIDDADGVRLADVGIAEGGDFDGALFGRAFDAGGGFGTGKTEGGEGEAGGARQFGIGAGDGLVFEHAEVGDVEFTAGGGKSHGEGETADFDGSDYKAGAGIDDGDAEVGLIDDEEEIAFGIEREVTGVAICVAGLVEIDHAAGTWGGGGIPIEESDFAGVAFGDVSGMFVDEGDAHEDAAPVGVGLAGVFPLGACEQMTDVPVRTFVAFDDGEGVAAGPSVSGDRGLAAGAESQAKRAGPGGKRFTMGRDYPPTG